MKGLLGIPDLSEREHAYRALESTARDELVISPFQWALWSQWTRLDPRLAELWAKAFSQAWQSVDPIRFREEVLAQPWPACAGVLLDQTIQYHLPARSKPLLRAWNKLVMTGIPKAPHEYYFIGIFSFGGERMRREVEAPFRSFARWGFLGQARFVNKASSRPSQTELLPARRRATLDSLISRQVRLTVQDYLLALPEGVSRRQAQLDLAAHPQLKATGKTRGRFYVRKR